MEKLVFKNSYNLFLLKPSSKISTQKFSLKVYKKLLKVKFFCIFLPSNQKLALKYCIFIKIDSNFSNFITIWFDKFFETGKFEVKSHIVHWLAVSQQKLSIACVTDNVRSFLPSSARFLSPFCLYFGATPYIEIRPIWQTDIFVATNKKPNCILFITWKQYY